MRRVLVFAVSLFALAACGGPHVSRHADGSTTIKGADGSSVTVNDGGGQAPPSHLPAYLKVFPGATIKSTVDTGKSGGMMMVETSAAPEAVVDFYKGEAKTAGLDVQMDMNNDGNHAVLFADPQGKGKRNFNISASKQPDGKTQALVTFNEQA
jgi:hypothetical protein